MIKTCPNCGKEIKSKNRTYCNDICLAEFWKKTNHEKALNRIREREKLQHECLWCRNVINWNQKYCCPECGDTYRKIKRRIMSLYTFENEKKQAEILKLERLGKNYRFESQIENNFYELL